MSASLSFPRPRRPEKIPWSLSERSSNTNSVSRAPSGAAIGGVYYGSGQAPSGITPPG
jgi:hypothetical protein